MRAHILTVLEAQDNTARWPVIVCSHAVSSPAATRTTTSAAALLRLALPVPGARPRPTSLGFGRGSVVVVEGFC